MNQKTVLIVDDHPLFREGLKAILGRDERYKVVGEADNGRKALRKANELKPDLAIIDISLPDISGIKLTYDIRSTLPETRVLIASMHSEIDYIAEAFQAGATGYLVKESASERLLQGLRAVAKGDYFIDSSISHQVVENIMKFTKKQERITNEAYDTLSSREQEITRLLAEGYSAKEIADKLFISPKTVANHRTNIMNKLDLKNTMELVRYAARLGLIDVARWKK